MQGTNSSAYLHTHPAAPPAATDSVSTITIAEILAGGPKPGNYCHLLLPCALKLFKEAAVILGEHSQVLNLIFQIGDAFDSHS